MEGAMSCSSFVQARIHDAAKVTSPAPEQVAVAAASCTVAALYPVGQAQVGTVPSCYNML